MYADIQAFLMAVHLWFSFHMNFRDSWIIAKDFFKWK